jgi:hypothetical protein
MRTSLFTTSAPTDDELGKKDDDHRAAAHPPPAPAFWPAGRSFTRVRRRRLVFFAASVFLIWFLFTHRLRDVLEPNNLVREDEANGGNFHGQMESSNSFGFVGRKPSRPAYVSADHGLDDDGDDGDDDGAVDPSRGKKPDRNKHATQHYYEGEMKFYQLPTSMRSAGRMDGWRAKNRNVLFAAASLQAVAVLMPMACEMAKRRSNHVHMAFMGRNDLSVDEMRQVNGIDREGCQVAFHNARPDYARYSSDLRAESSVTSAYKYIQEYMHPQVVITHAEGEEDDYFIRATKRKSHEYGWPHVQIPSQMPPSKASLRPTTDNLGWISKLDAAALASWETPGIEIVVQAPTGFRSIDQASGFTAQGRLYRHHAPSAYH